MIIFSGMYSGLVSTQRHRFPGAAPAQLQLTHDQSALAQRGHYFVDRSNLVLRDVYSHAIQFGQHQEADEADEAKTLGLCLGLAPQINPNDFIPRAAEIDAMSQVL